MRRRSCLRKYQVASASPWRWKGELILSYRPAAELPCVLTRLPDEERGKFASPTIVLITDRTDRDDQLSGQSPNAKGFYKEIM